MLVESVVRSPQPAWREPIDRQVKPVGAAAPIASLNRPNDDVDPDPPPASPAILPWPRVFPGL
jgi:hypothetical protein